MSSLRPRAKGRTATVVAQQTATEHPSGFPEHTFELDFDNRRAAQATEPAPLPRKRDDSIKQAIIRWLNEEL